MLPLEPAGADAEVSPATGEDIERGHRLHQDAGLAVGDAGDHRAQRDPLGHAGGKRQGRVPLQHRLRHLANMRDLKEVIHDPERIEAPLVGVAGDAGELRGNAGVAAGGHESGDRDTEFHSDCTPEASVPDVNSR